MVRRQAKWARSMRGEDAAGNRTLDRRVQLSDARAANSLDVLEPASTEEISAGLHHLLRHSQEERKLQEEIHAPVSLDADTRHALMKVVSERGGRLQVDALPAFVRKGASAQKTPVRSTGRKQMAQWLESEEGQAWKLQRDEL